MRGFIFFLSALMCTGITHAQTNQYLTHTDSDPQALVLLDKLQGLLKKELLSLDFSISVTYPAEEPVQYKGQLIQQGDKYRIISDNLNIWCNGTLRWVYTRDANEVNLYSAENDEFGGPLSYFAEYTGDAYVAILRGTDQIRSMTVQVIELKPVDSNSEIAKVRLFMHNDGKPARIEILEKTATRTLSDITRITTPEKHPDAFFAFNKADYPGVHVEDMRID